MLSLRSSVLVLAMVLGSVTGCVTPSPSQGGPCVPASTLECLCANGKPGLDSCMPNQKWSGCQCAGDSGVGGGLHKDGGQSGAGGQSGSGGGGGSSGSTGHVDGSVANLDDSGTAGSPAPLDGSVPVATKPAYSGPCAADNECPASQTCVKSTQLLPPATLSSCALSCTTATDCPAAPSGSTAMPTCSVPLGSTKGTCVLACPAFTTCPTGMMCPVPPLFSTSQCVWSK